MLRSEWISCLDPYLPKGTSHAIANWIVAHQIDFKIVKHRATKLGDFRPSHQGKPHCITVNKTLNPYSFLVTTVHEFAHFHAHVDFGNRIQPHGQEWKQTYSDLLKPFVFDDIFPNELRHSVLLHIKRPSASSCADTRLMRELRKFDHVPATFLENLPKGSTFRIGKRTFVKGELIRKRYLCRQLETNRLYRVHPLAEIELIA